MVGISKRFEKRALKSQGLAGCGKSVFSISVNAAGVESKGGGKVLHPTLRGEAAKDGAPGKWVTARTKTTADPVGNDNKRERLGKELSAEVRGGMLLLGF
jgi:hypothetical protein